MSTSPPKPSTVKGTQLLPSLADVFFCGIFVALFWRPGGFEALLADGDTGWHIRTGDLILSAGSVPATDPFSYSKAGAPWLAWEWLSDVVFAAAHGWGGLAAVAALSGLILCLAAVVLLIWLVRRGAGLWISGAITLAAFSAGSIHFLARPHVFSILFYAVSLWALDEDRRWPGARIWLLAPLAALWANLHGGFVALIATLALASAASATERDWFRARRYAALAGTCLAATLANPYGWKLHFHVAQYLDSDWILANVQEFQSPSIRSESMMVFAVLLLGGAALAWRGRGEARRFEGALALFWGAAALRSARHIPLYALSAAPVIASGCQEFWRNSALRAPAGSAQRVFWELGSDLGAATRPTFWTGAFCVLALACVSRDGTEFPKRSFPVEAIERNQALLAPQGAAPRILTSDQWAGYLLFRLYPRQRVFMDGRSDFYGAALGADYQTLIAGRADWRRVFERYGFQMALLPASWPLNSLLQREPGWSLVYQDPVSAIYARGGGKPTGAPLLLARNGS